MSNSQYWVWIDLEMTGLDPKRDTIIEIATIITDTALNIVAKGPDLAIWQPASQLAKMDDWNQKHHTDSGLIDRVKASKESLASAQNQTLSFLKQYLKPNQAPLCGNSIGTDRRFLAEYMPELESFLHYRNLDVSSLKILAKAWKPQVADQFKKKNTHRALDDICESIDELKHYYQHWLSHE